MKSNLSFKEELEYQTTEHAAREKISDLVDLAFDAYLHAGYSLESYVKTQFFINLLFQSVNQLEPLSRERLGGLQLTIRFMQRLVDHYNTTPAGGKKNVT